MTRPSSGTWLALALLGGVSLACESTIGPQGGTAGTGAGTAGTGAGNAGSNGATAGSAGGASGGANAGTGGGTSGLAGRGGTTGAAGTMGAAGGGAAGRGGTTGAAGSGAAGRGGTQGTAGTTATAGTTGTAGTSGAAGAGGAPTAADVCARWKADRADLSEGTWTGDVTSCTAGDIGTTARANALRLVNLYRWLASLPPVVTDPTKDMQDQQCALMMRANNMISHSPPTTWTCYTADGATAAGSSNVSSGRAVSSVDLYMIDPGNATTIGHRRWVLSNSLGPIGIGGTDRASCMWTLSGTGRAGKQWMAWPAAGIIPLQAMRSGGNVDSTGWSLQSDNINLTGATVTVTMDAADQPVTVTQLDQNYGAKYAIRFNPSGWATQAGKTYSVAVSNIPTAINYTVQIVDCP